MEKSSNTKIGSTTKKGISGGERKRTSIAYDLISNPPIVIIDEPTTGMDSFTSLTIIKYLKLLANSGKTVIMTIHQPGSEIFDYIDRLILLKDGFLVFQGKAQHSVKFFNEIGLPLPQFCNPFDFFLELMNDNGMKNKNTAIKNLHHGYKRLCDSDVRDEKTKNHEEFKIKESTTMKKGTRQIHWFIEFYILLKRIVVNYVRNKDIFYGRIINCLCNSLLVMSFYWQIGKSEIPQEVYLNYVGFYYTVINQFFWNGLYTAVQFVPEIKNVLKREYSNKMYRISTYYLATVIGLLVNTVLYTTIFSLSVYFSTGFNYSVKNFVEFYFFLFFTFTIAQNFGLFLSASLDEALVLLIANFAGIFFSVGSGFIVGNNSISKYFSWLFYTSPYRYLMEIGLNIDKNFSPITQHIPEDFNYTYGELICFPILFGSMLIFIILGGFGMKKSSAKF